MVDYRIFAAEHRAVASEEQVILVSESTRGRCDAGRDQDGTETTRICSYIVVQTYGVLWKELPSNKDVTDGARVEH